jgi:hypothetical protein
MRVRVSARTISGWPPLFEVLEAEAAPLAKGDRLQFHIRRHGTARLEIVVLHFNADEQEPGRTFAGEVKESGGCLRVETVLLAIAALSRCNNNSPAGLPSASSDSSVTSSDRIFQRFAANSQVCIPIDRNAKTGCASFGGVYSVPIRSKPSCRAQATISSSRPAMSCAARQRSGNSDARPVSKS